VEELQWGRQDLVRLRELYGVAAVNEAVVRVERALERDGVLTPRLLELVEGGSEGQVYELESLGQRVQSVEQVASRMCADADTHVSGAPRERASLRYTVKVSERDSERRGLWGGVVDRLREGGFGVSSLVRLYDREGRCGGVRGVFRMGAVLMVWVL